MRSCAVFGKIRAVSPWENENVDFWNTAHEKAVEEWAEKNQKPAGRGTDTLREARAIYLPVITQNGVAVVSFSCAHSKLSVTERLIFGQIESLLRLIL